MLSFGLNPWLLALCALAAAALAYWSYRATVPALTTGRRVLLGGLRFVALFLILFLLFEPVLRRIEQDILPPALAVLIDDSQSLSLANETDDEQPSLNLAEQMRQTLRSLPADAVSGAVKLYRFSSDVSPVVSDPSWPDSLGFAGERTNIARALDHVRDDLKDANLQGVVLISDGRYNTGRNPLYLAQRYPVPIHAVAVGDTTLRRDLQIRRVTTNEIAYVGTALPIQVGLRAEAVAGERVNVSLIQNGQVLDNQVATLPAGTAELPVDLSFTPEAEGLLRLTVAVTQLEGEVTYRNNTESFTVRVLENKRRILLLGGAPSPDVAALRQVLEADPDAEVVARVAQRRGQFYEGPLPTDFSTIDLIILAGYPGPAATASEIRQIVAAAEAGTPLLFVLDRQTNVRLMQQLQSVLPIRPRTVRAGFIEAALLPTTLATNHPIFDLPAIPDALLASLPPLYYNESRWEASPDARVLATSQVRGVALDDPMLVIRSRSGQRSVALLGAGTWRWKNVPTDLNALAPFWPALVENMIQWVTTREDNRPVRVRPVTDLFAGGEAVMLEGQVYDESLNPVHDAAVEVSLTTPEGNTLPYTMEAMGNGRYLLDIGSLPEGTYAYTAKAEENDGELGEDRGSFAVGALALEFKETRADVPLMRQIAQRSGGTFLTASGLEGLPAMLAADARFRPVVLEETREIELRRRYAFLIAILVLLTAEWFFRKRSGMV